MNNVCRPVLLEDRTRLRPVPAAIADRGPVILLAYDRRYEEMLRDERFTFEICPRAA